MIKSKYNIRAIHRERETLRVQVWVNKLLSWSRKSANFEHYLLLLWWQDFTAGSQSVFASARVRKMIGTNLGQKLRHN